MEQLLDGRVNEGQRSWVRGCLYPGGEIEVVSGFLQCCHGAKLAGRVAVLCVGGGHRQKYLYWERL